MSTCCHLLLTWLQAALFSRLVDCEHADAQRFEEAVSILDIAARELRDIEKFGGGDAGVVARWASEKLAPYGFEALPSTMEALCQALEKLPATTKPVHSPSDDTPAEDMLVSQSSKEHQPSAAPVRPRVLWVEMQAPSSVSAHIESHGFVTDTCTGAKTALILLRNSFYPIVIIDSQMPVTAGLDLCRKLRSRRFRGYIYIIFLSSENHVGSAISAIQAGADDCLAKECLPAQLLARLCVAERIVTLDHRLRRALKNAAREAASDVLTRLPNRRAFHRRLHSEIKRARRFGESLAVLLIDVDHFKQINDRFGHLVGDEVLRDLARTLRTHLPREFDFLARIGGEEFAAALPHTDRSAAHVVAERLRSAVAEHRVHTTAGEVRITISVGVASSCSDPGAAQLTMQGLLQEADCCLYASKRRGRNRVTAPAKDSYYLLGT